MKALELVRMINKARRSGDPTAELERKLGEVEREAQRTIRPRCKAQRRAQQERDARARQRDEMFKSRDTQRAALAELIREAKSRGFRIGWASHQFLKRFGHWPAARLKWGLRELRETFDE